MSESNLDAKYIQMTQTPVERLICRLAVPTIISNLITTFQLLPAFLGNQPFGKCADSLE